MPNDAQCFKTAGEVRAYLARLGLTATWVHPTADLFTNEPEFIAHLPHVTRVNPRAALDSVRYAGREARRFDRVRGFAHSIGLSFDMEERTEAKASEPWWRT